MIDRLETEHLVLRKAKEEDLDSIWNSIWKDTDIAQSMLWKPTFTYEEAIERLSKTIRYQAEHFAYFVCLKENHCNTAIGFAGINEEEPGIYAESGICVAQKYQNLGFGKEIVKALLQLVFEELSGKKFIYSCFHENLRSAAICRFFGFQYSYCKEDVREWDGYSYLSDYYELSKKNYEIWKTNYTLLSPPKK